MNTGVANKNGTTDQAISSPPASENSATPSPAPPHDGSVTPIATSREGALDAEPPSPLADAHLPEDLVELRQLVENVKSRARACRDWYNENAFKQGKNSRRLRWLSVLMVVLGGLCPLIPEALGGEALQPIGYLLLAAAAGLVVFDRAFGCSSAWMRYRMAHMCIDKELSLYDNASATLLAGASGTNNGAKSNVRILVASTHTFLTSIEDIVVQETESWLAEFKAEHASFQQQYGNRKAPDSK